MPTWHGKTELIKRAVDSVLAQTYENVEVVLVDDKGTMLLRRTGWKHKSLQNLMTAGSSTFKMIKILGQLCLGTTASSTQTASILRFLTMTTAICRKRWKISLHI